MKRDSISFQLENKPSKTIGIKESKEEKLLGVIADKTLGFKHQVRSICKKAGQKLHALLMVSHFLIPNN